MVNLCERSSDTNSCLSLVLWGWMVEKKFSVGNKSLSPCLEKEWNTRGQLVSLFFPLSDNVMAALWWGHKDPVFLCITTTLKSNNEVTATWLWQHLQNAKLMIEYSSVMQNINYFWFNQFLSLMNFRAAITSTVSLQLCILSGIISTAPRRGVRVDLIGPLGQVKSSQILPQQKIYVSNTSCHSVHDRFRLSVVRHHTSQVHLAHKVTKSGPGEKQLSSWVSQYLRLHHCWWVVERINTEKHSDLLVI